MGNSRLEGLDFARLMAFIGMVLVNFRLAMVEGNPMKETGFASVFIDSLEGKAAACFVVLAGVGLGLAHTRASSNTAVIFKRALFLMILGLVNALIFPADILHYYAVYFVFGALLLPLSNQQLIGVIAALNGLFLVLMFSLDYQAGWRWEDYSYTDFWTFEGFVRNLFFNGFHPLLPWLGFLVFGLLISRLPLASNKLQIKLTLAGGLAVAVAQGLSLVATPLAGEIDPELVDLVATAPLPPVPLYFVVGCGSGCLVIGSCLWLAQKLPQGLLAWPCAAGRQGLTLYIAHILLGMGVLEEMGLLGQRSSDEAILASAIFCALAIVYAVVYSQRFKRGPIEALMRRVAG